jgi:hypothetical protein
VFLCVLSGRGLCDEMITRPEESYRLGASLCVIKKPRKRGGHSPRWAAEPDRERGRERLCYEVSYIRQLINMGKYKAV